MNSGNSKKGDGTIFISRRSSSRLSEEFANGGGSGSDRLMSKSFGGDSSSLLLRGSVGVGGVSKSCLQRHISTDMSITYSGYLLKRSNRPYRETHDNNHIVDIDPFNIPELPRMRGMFSSQPPHHHHDPIVDHDPSVAALLRPSTDNSYPPTQQQSTTSLSSPLLIPIVTPSPLPQQQVASATATPTGIYTESQTTITDSTLQPRIASEDESFSNDKTPIQKGIDALAGFFGISPGSGKMKQQLEEPQHQEEQQRDGTTLTTQPLHLQNDNTTQQQQQQQQQQQPLSFPKSSPIKVATKNTHTYENRSSFQSAAYHRHHSAPTVTVDTDELLEHDDFSPHHRNNNHHCLAPNDFIDPEGHLWRAKYCVLEDGILYFYRNTADGESPEAVNERRRESSKSEDQSSASSSSLDIGGGITGGKSSSTMGSRKFSSKDLAKSPMPRARHLTSMLSASDESSSGNMWEKKVHLNCVAAVRSTEQEYGPNSFELIGIDDDDSNDGNDGEGTNETLVLQAKDQADMKEWIFQFHRSLASFLRNIMGPYLDLDYFSSATVKQKPRLSTLLSSSPSEKQLYELMRRQQESPSLSHSLSHGHGRITAHTRRQRQDSSSSVFSSPAAPESSPYYRGGPAIDSNDSSRQQQQYSPSRHHETNYFSTTPDSHGSGSPQQFVLLLKDEPSAVGDKSPVTSSSPAGKSYLIPPATAARPNESYIPSQPPPLPQQQRQQPPQLQPRGEPLAPELAAPESAYPETERPKPTVTAGKKYVPPHLRKKQAASGAAGPPLPKGKYIPPHLRNKQKANNNNIVPSQPPSMDAKDIEATTGGGKGNIEQAAFSIGAINMEEASSNEQIDSLDIVKESTVPFKRGGCADPVVMEGSILDAIFIPRKASRLGKVPTKPYGCYGGGDDPTITDSEQPTRLKWETGAVSECGIRDSNEDAYLISSDLLEAFKTLPQWSINANNSWNNSDVLHNLGLFTIFDGHCGNEAARFAVEKLASYILEETNEQPPNPPLAPENVERVLRNAILKLDDQFCETCQDEGRFWESGATALVALLVNEHFVIANLGDCRGVLCRSVQDDRSYREDAMWTQLDTVVDDTGRRSNDVEIGDDSQVCFWKEVTDIHSPSAPEERERIEKSNGWVTTETEIPIGQLRRIDFQDDDVIGILKRCCSSNPGHEGKESRSAPQRILEISRVCGELAVSRALGDRDFKSDFNPPESASDIENGLWDCPLFLPFPDQQARKFRGDLVSNQPSFQTVKVCELGVREEFLLFGCDGLWDVLDVDDAVRVTRDLLYRKQWTAKKSAARLAELAIHLGSSDNITVIVVRLFSKENDGKVSDMGT